MLARNGATVPLGISRPGGPPKRLDRRAVAEILEPLSRLDPNALALLLDVRHFERTPAAAGGAMVAGPTGRIGPDSG